MSNGMSLRAICQMPGMPSRSTAQLWLNKYREFSELYGQAAIERASFLAEDALIIADAATPEDVKVAELRVETRKWICSHLAPKKWGLKVAVGGDADNPLRVETDVTTYTPAEAYARMLKP